MLPLKTGAELVRTVLRFVQQLGCRVNVLGGKNLNLKTNFGDGLAESSGHKHLHSGGKFIAHSRQAVNMVTNLG
jgi:hypothetical protein